MSQNFGKLFLLPVPLAPEAREKSFTPYWTAIANQLKTYIVEQEKTARKFLKEGGLLIPQSDLKIYDYGKHKRGQSVEMFFKELKAGEDVGLMSEAGCPGVADPGAEIVAYAHSKGIQVVPLVGPNSMIQALMASGLTGQSFAFHGYLPIDKNDRSKKIKELEQLSMRHRQTQLFMETPFRNNQLFEEILKSCTGNTELCVAVNINAPDEFIQTKPIAKWKLQKLDLHKKPCIFLLLKKA
ncbi:MAG: SAM-dependent methyltransferase [Pedobacter sp.]|nr:MAG: SAM-dependent methyltransferase [Pedobacter sp.]